MVKTQPSLFVFNSNSHLEGIVHYNTNLNNLTDMKNQWKLNDSKFLYTKELEEEEDYLDLDQLEEEELEDEEDFDFDLDEEEDLDDEEDDL